MSGDYALPPSPPSDEQWQKMAKEYVKSKPLGETRTGIFGRKGWTDYNNFKKAAGDSGKVEAVINRTLEEAVEKMRSGEKKKIKEGEKQLKSIGGALRWLNQEQIEKLDLGRFKEIGNIGKKVEEFVLKKSLYSLEKQNPEKAKAIFEAYSKTADLALWYTGTTTDVDTPPPSKPRRFERVAKTESMNSRKEKDTRSRRNAVTGPSDEATSKKVTDVVKEYHGPMKGSPLTYSGLSGESFPVESRNEVPEVLSKSGNTPGAGKSALDEGLERLKKLMKETEEAEPVKPKKPVLKKPAPKKTAPSAKDTKPEAGAGTLGAGESLTKKHTREPSLLHWEGTQEVLPEISSLSERTRSDSIVQDKDYLDIAGLSDAELQETAGAEEQTGPATVAREEPKAAQAAIEKLLNSGQEKDIPEAARMLNEYGHAEDVQKVLEEPAMRLSTLYSLIGKIGEKYETVFFKALRAKMEFVAIDSASLVRLAQKKRAKADRTRQEQIQHIKALAQNPDLKAACQRFLDFLTKP
jgi:hypothetical protein